jgi:hypothetical protein
VRNFEKPLGDQNLCFKFSNSWLTSLHEIVTSLQRRHSSTTCN